MAEIQEGSKVARAEVNVGATDWRDGNGRRWELWQGLMVECPSCGFTFGADHTNAMDEDDPDGYSCPLCDITAYHTHASLLLAREMYANECIRMAEDDKAAWDDDALLSEVYDEFLGRARVALTTEAARRPLTPESVSESRSGVVCRPTEGKQQ